jgi:thiamine biosynthesis protein ThiS
MGSMPKDSAAASLEVILNGTPRRFDGPLSIAALLERLSLRQPHVAVELNGELIPRGMHSATDIRSGDRLEVVTLVGGG